MASCIDNEIPVKTTCWHLFRSLCRLFHGRSTLFALKCSCRRLWSRGRGQGWRNGESTGVPRHPWLGPIVESKPYVGWGKWFRLPFSERFSHVLGVSHLAKNQHMIWCTGSITDGFVLLRLRKLFELIEKDFARVWYKISLVTKTTHRVFFFSSL